MKNRRERINRTVIKLGNAIFKHLGPPMADRYVMKSRMPWSEFVQCVEDYLISNGVSRDTPVFSLDVQEVEIGARISVYIGNSTNALFVTDQN